MNTTLEKLGEPDLKFSGFSLWVHGRESIDPGSDHEGIRLRVTAHCGDFGASVSTHGSILMAEDIGRFRDQCEEISKGAAKFANLDPYEPGLHISLESVDSLGHLKAIVEITPNHLSQEHKFEFDIDQTYLRDIIDQSTKIVNRYPCRD